MSDNPKIEQFDRHTRRVRIDDHEYFNVTTHQKRYIRFEITDEEGVYVQKPSMSLKNIGTVIELLQEQKERMERERNTR